MTSLNKIFIEQAIDDVRRFSLVQLLNNKLQEKNIPDENGSIAEAISDAIFEALDSEDKSEEEAVIVPDWIEELLPEGFGIEFTESDMDVLEKEAKNLVKGHLSDSLVWAVKETAKDTLKALEGHWRMIKADHVASEAFHKERIKYFWGDCLSTFELMLEILQDNMEKETDSLLRSKAKRNRQKREVKLMLLSRAIETANEVNILLRSGMCNGAFARWRTLDELTILMQFIEQQDNGTSERYLAHETIDDYEYNRLLRKVSPKSVKKAELTKLSKLREELIGIYGENFSKPYGWAAMALGKERGRVTLSEIASFVKKEAITPEYKMASWKIHASVSGFTWNVHESEYGEIFQSMEVSGLHLPLISSVYSLTQIAAWHIGASTSIEKQIEITLMVLMRDKVERNARKAQRVLANMTVQLGDFEQ